MRSEIRRIIALMTAGMLLVEGKSIENGTDLGITGYDNMTVIDHLAFGDASIEFTQDNIADYDF